MKLSDVINGTQTVSLISESDTHAALSLVDQRTGEVKRLDISADMVPMPDEAILDCRAMDVQWNTFPVDYQDAHYDDNSHDIPAAHGLTQDEYLPSTWTITPDGQEIDLRVREGGLF